MPPGPSATIISRVVDVYFVNTDEVVITMGCGDACPLYPGKKYEDWELDDPAGQPIKKVRQIRDDIGRHVEQLLRELSVPIKR